MSIPTPTLPSSNGAYKLSANGLEVTLPRTVTSDDEPIAARNYFSEVEGRDGLFPIRSPNFGGRDITLTGFITDEDTVKQLKTILTFKRVTIERDNRILEADIGGASIVEEVYGSIWRVEVSFNAAKYYWSAKELTVDTDSPGVVAYNGTAISYPIFTVEAPAGGLQTAHFDLNGRSADFTGNLSQGEILVIDCENLSAVVGSSSVTGNMNDEFFVAPPFLLPGSNVINATINGTEYFPVLIEYAGEPVYYNGQPVYYYPFATEFEVKFLERFL